MGLYGAVHRVNRPYLVINVYPQLFDRYKALIHNSLIGHASPRLSVRRLIDLRGGLSRLIGASFRQSIEVSALPSASTFANAFNILKGFSIQKSCSP